jgi:hypothetical protein
VHLLLPALPSAPLHWLLTACGSIHAASCTHCTTHSPACTQERHVCIAGRAVLHGLFIWCEWVLSQPQQGAACVAEMSRWCRTM